MALGDLRGFSPKGCPGPRLGPFSNHRAWATLAAVEFFGGRSRNSALGHRVMSRTIVIYFILALLFALLLVWLLVRFLICCCSPIDAAFCQL